LVPVGIAAATLMVSAFDATGVVAATATVSAESVAPVATFIGGASVCVAGWVAGVATA
jgi:hypothetical protein